MRYKNVKMYKDVYKNKYTILVGELIMENNGKKNKVCAILWTVAAVCELIAGILETVENGFNFSGITNLATGFCSGCLAVIYYCKMKKQ